MIGEVVSHTERIKWVRASGALGKVGIEVGRLPHGDYAIRSSAFRANTVVVTEDELAEFFHAVHAGHFNSLIEVIR
jgi:hypothetical protein